MKTLALSDVLRLHEQIIRQSGGSFGIRNQEAIESALLQSSATFINDQEQIILQIASGELSRELFTDWLKLHLKPL